MALFTSLLNQVQTTLAARLGAGVDGNSPAPAEPDRTLTGTSLLRGEAFALSVPKDKFDAHFTREGRTLADVVAGRNSGNRVG